MVKTPVSEGEDLIADFLEEKLITFKRNVELKNLVGDTKSYRTADFYLPDYKIYIEFLGKWNTSEQHKVSYKQKMSIYSKSKIPCIYLWPDNLGTLDWMFPRRMREVLLRYNMKSTLIEYEFGNYLREFGFSILFLSLIILLADGFIWKISLSLYLIYHLYSTIKKYVDRLKKLKISVNSWKKQ